MLTGTYLPGDTLVHRASPGAKALTLVVFVIVLIGWGAPAVVGVGALLVVGAYGVARVPARVALAQVWPLRWFVLVLFAVQVWTAGWSAAAVACGNLVVAVAAASLVTLTTRVDDMRTALEAGLARLHLPGVDPARVGLAVALTIRSIAVVGRLSDETREARRARGLDRSPRALVTPLVVRTVRHAQRVGDALIARGVDD